MLLRLDKILGSLKEASRKDLKAIIKSGRVTVDGIPVLSSKEKFDPALCRIELDGVRVEYKKYRYIMMNKPAGYISATTDEKEKTVMELLPENYAKMGLSPAGRLDKDAEGLLLLTNDGDTAHSITSPRRHVDKVYFVRVEGILDLSDVAEFESGMELSDGEICMPARLKILDSCTAHVTLTEGKFHQVKRMFLKRGKHVVYLKRIRMGNLVLDETLCPGEFRELTPHEEALILGKTPY